MCIHYDALSRKEKAPHVARPRKRSFPRKEMSVLYPTLLVLQEW
jgi:hypothetical protein